MLTFGPFYLDRRNEQLWQGQKQCRLTHKAFAVLTCLVEHVGQLMTKETLLEAVWPDTYVSDAALVVCVREIRQALGDRPKMPQYIETVYRRGYRFISPVTPSEPSSLGQQSVDLNPTLLGWPKGTLATLRQSLVDMLKSKCQMDGIQGEIGIGQAMSDGIALAPGEADVRWPIDVGLRREQYKEVEVHLKLMHLSPEFANAMERLITERPLVLVIYLMQRQKD